jgi:hypothetical protein
MRAVSCALFAVTLLWGAAAAQSTPDLLPSASSGSAQSTGKPASSSARKAPIGHRSQGREMCRPGSRKISEQGPPKTRPSVGNFGSAAIADFVCAHRSG